MRLGARQRAGRLDPEIFDAEFQNPDFFDPEKNLILNPEPGSDLKFSLETDPDRIFSQPRTRSVTRILNFSTLKPARKNPALCRALFEISFKF